MHHTSIKPVSTKGQKNNKNICDAFGCYSKASEKLGVSAGTFGTIILHLCSKCVTIFKESEA